MYLSLYMLTFQESRACRLYDTYACHQLVYGLFPGLSTDRRTILYADRGVKNRRRQLLVLSSIPPDPPAVGALHVKEIPAGYFDFPAYRFQIVINPVRRLSRVGKIVPIRGRQEIAEWFVEKAPSWGFETPEANLQVGRIWVDQFARKGGGVTIGKANVQGSLRVADREEFIRSATRGIGRGRAFGCGLLQIVPADPSCGTAQF